jgi:hypothetical protein
MPPISDYLKIRMGYLTVNQGSPPHLRFWARVEKNGPVHPVCGRCWIWVGGSVDVGGYGHLMANRRFLKVHRYSWELHNGAVPSGLCVLHRCDNPPCVNPAHLFLGNRTDNARDRTAKGREARGEANGASKLTPAIVREIRIRYLAGDCKNGMNALAREFSVTVVAVWQVIHGKSWRHVQ